MASGHRPCAECRRDAYQRYRLAWATGHEEALPSAQKMNVRLHAQRLWRHTHTRRLHPMDWHAVPAGTFVLLGGTPAVTLNHVVVPWTVNGYVAATVRPAGGTVDVITPPSSVAALRAGYPVQIDLSATAQDLTCEKEFRHLRK